MTKYSGLILLADDDIDDQELLKTAISETNSNIQIDSVTDGRQLVEYLVQLGSRKFPDLIILDYQMPFFRAPDILRKFSDNSSFVSTKKVIWSTSANIDHINECLSLGANHYFLKPSSEIALRDIVERILYMLPR
jgi:CheY-like chemotaxis protein